MEHDIIVIRSNRTIDSDYTMRRLRALIKDAVQKLKERKAKEQEIVGDFSAQEIYDKMKEVGIE